VSESEAGIRAQRRTPEAREPKMRAQNATPKWRRRQAERRRAPEKEGVALWEWSE